MRKLIISIATAATLISVAGSTSFAVLNETQIAAPIMTAQHQPVIRASEFGHWPRHGHSPLFGL